MELDDMKLAWQELGQRIDKQHTLSLQFFRNDRLDRMRQQLRPLMFGQSVQITLGAALSLFAGGYWFDHHDSLHLLVYGVLVHAYALMMIVFAARNLYLIGRLDYSQPVLDIQRRLAELRSWKMRVEARWLAVAGCFLWIPMTLMLFAMGDIDVWQHSPRVVYWLIASGMVCCTLVLLARYLFKRMGKASWLDDNMVGRSVQRAETSLEELNRFGCE